MRFCAWWLVVAASCPAASLHFAIVGDRTGRAVPGVYEQAWREISGTNPNFVVTVGDAIEGFNGGGAIQEWAAVKRFWLPSVPIYSTPGNHDIWDAASEKIYIRETGRQPSYAFHFEGVHGIVLDNSRTDDLDAAQLAFLGSELRQGSRKNLTLIFFHRSFWLLPLKLRIGFALQKLVRDYGVCCVISGHGHQFQTVSADGALYLEVGSSGASLAAAGPPGTAYADGWFYEYVLARVEGRSVTFEIRELGAPWGQGRSRLLRAGENR